MPAPGSAHSAPVKATAPRGGNPQEARNFRHWIGAECRLADSFLRFLAISRPLMRVQQMLLPRVMVAATCVATTLEKCRPLSVDTLVPEPIFTSTHAITIDAPPEQVWPWIAQMGAGRRDWYSWDAIDHGGTPSATSIRLNFQTVAAGEVMPATPVPRTRSSSRRSIHSAISCSRFPMFGGLMFLEAPRLQMNLPTPWIGLWERINISVFLMWVVVLAAGLWRPVRAQGEVR